jgi:hypothetical protein
VILLLALAEAVGPDIDLPAVAPPSAVAFADHLYADGDFEAARLEYRRVVHGGGAEAPRAALRVGECAWGAGRYPEAELWFAGLRNPEGELGRAISVAKQGRFDEAATALERADGPAELRAFALWAAGWARLDARQEGYARADFTQLAGTAFAAEAEAVLAGLDRAPPARRRSPAGAAVLSTILPGAGQAWAGDWQDAAAALVVNGLFAAGTVELARTEQVPGAVALGLVGATFWGGNVMAATDSARRFDARSWDAHVAPVSHLRCTPVLTPTPGCAPR